MKHHFYASRLIMVVGMLVVTSLLGCTASKDPLNPSPTILDDPNFLHNAVNTGVALFRVRFTKDIPIALKIAQELQPLVATAVLNADTVLADVIALIPSQKFTDEQKLIEQSLILLISGVTHTYFAQHPITTPEQARLVVVQLLGWVIDDLK